MKTLLDIMMQEGYSENKLFERLYSKQHPIPDENIINKNIDYLTKEELIKRFKGMSKSYSFITIQDFVSKIKLTLEKYLEVNPIQDITKLDWTKTKSKSIKSYDYCVNCDEYYDINGNKVFKVKIDREFCKNVETLAQKVGYKMIENEEMIFSDENKAKKYVSHLRLKMQKNDQLGDL